MPTQIRCWKCKWCDKEHVKIAGEYIENGKGNCAAEYSKANGANWFYARVYKSTVQIGCEQFNVITPKK